MRWSIEGDNDVVLYAEEGEAIYEVYCQFWKRVLSDALVLDASLPWVSMHICIQDKQLPDDAEGQLDLAFKDEKKRRLSWYTKVFSLLRPVYFSL